MHKKSCTRVTLTGQDFLGPLRLLRTQHHENVKLDNYAWAPHTTWHKNVGWGGVNGRGSAIIATPNNKQVVVPGEAMMSARRFFIDRDRQRRAPKNDANIYILLLLWLWNDPPVSCKEEAMNIGTGNAAPAH